MLTDAHCHHYDLSQIFPEAEHERREIISPYGEKGVTAASSAFNAKEISHNEEIAHNAANEQAAALIPCFGIHPQFFSAWNKECGVRNEELGIKNKLKTLIDEKLFMLDNLALNKRISAVGECGFDLYSKALRETEFWQDKVFLEHLETANRHNLPVILHVRRAMHKIFPLTKQLSKCKAVVFHSWPGTYEEAVSLLRRGVNAYFSFGNIIILNHKQAIRSCALLPADRLLTETDAPYQSRRAERFSKWTDLPLVLEAAANLRSEAGNSVTVFDLEKQIENNFNNIYSSSFSSAAPRL